MTAVLINLFYLGVVALVVAAGLYVYKTRPQAASGEDEPETGD